MTGQTLTVERHALSDDVVKALGIDFTSFDNWEEKRRAAEFVIQAFHGNPPKNGKPRQVWDVARFVLTEYARGQPPPEYRVEIFDHILNAIAEGRTVKASVAEINEKFGIILPVSNVYHWVERIPEFGEAYHRARRLHAHALQDDALDKADMAKDRDSALAARIHTETRLTLAARWNPSEFSDKRNGSTGITINLNTPIGNEPSSVIDHDGGFNILVDVTPQK